MGLVPYTTTPFNRMSFPLKVPQYLAAGLAVVSTPNGATDHFGDAVVVADDPALFAQGVRDAVASLGDEGARCRRQAAARRTWSDVADQFLTIVAAPR